MGWNNCTQQEAQDAFDYAKGQYKKASEGFLVNKQTLDKYQYDYSVEKNNYDSAASDKVNFEKRVIGIEGVIGFLDVNGYVNERIDDTNSTSAKLEENWDSYVKCNDVGKPELSRAFRLPSVESFSYSELALLKLKNERDRLVRAIEDLKKQMQQMEENINNMVNEMNAIQADQARLSRIMSESSYEMNHYKKFL